ncbi:MAG: S8 family serine peptidase [Chloroherpetonaceae bacterium]|nr:S8 family serine peptidase [Chloroherpetonaceae bacterium]
MKKFSMMNCFSFFRFALFFIAIATFFSSDCYAQPVSKAQQIKSSRQSQAYMPGMLIVKFKNEESLTINERETVGGTNNVQYVERFLSQFGMKEMRPIWKKGYSEKLESVLKERSTVSRMESQKDPQTAVAEISRDMSRIYEVYYSSPEDAASLARRISSLAGVEYAEPNYIYETTLIPNDTLFNTSGHDFFNYQNIPSAWDLSTGSSSVIIGITDSGIDYNHPDLQGKIWTNPGETGLDGQSRDKSTNGIDDDGNGYVDDWRGWDFWNSGSTTAVADNNPLDEFSGHGTHVAGTAGAATDNVTGVAGVGYNCRVMAVKAGGTQASPRAVGFGYQAILYAAVNGAQIINCSWGGSSSSSLGKNTIDQVLALGVVIVAAAGNSNTNALFYPAAFDGVLSVGSVNHTGSIGSKSSFSNFGNWVDVYATGNGILSTVPLRSVDVNPNYNANRPYASLGGTSMASPVVAGLAGLMRSKFPTWSGKRIMSQIRGTSQFLSSLNGRKIDALAALSDTSNPAVEFDNFSYNASNQTVTINVTNYGEEATINFNLIQQGTQTITINDASKSVKLPKDAKATLIYQLTIPGNVNLNFNSLNLTLNYTSSNYTDAQNIDIFNKVWSSVFSLNAIDLHSIYSPSKNVVWVCGDGGEVFLSTDGANTWTKKAAPTSQNLYTVFALDATTAFVGDGASSGASIYRTTNGGSTWETVYTGPSGSFFNYIHFWNSTNGIALSDPAGDPFVYLVVKTTNGGTTWDRTVDVTPPTSGEFGLNNGAFFLDENFGWFGTNQGRVFRTANGGDTWVDTPIQDATNAWVWGIAFTNNANGVVGGYRVTSNAISGGVLARTNTGGETFTTAAYPSNSPTVQFPASIGAYKGTNAIWMLAAVGSSASSISGFQPFFSRDGGNTWLRRFSDPFPSNTVYFSFVPKSDSLIGYALANGFQIFRYAESETILSSPSEGGPRVHPFNLSQNYPNPFNPSTTIQYQIANASDVKLEVFDVLGRKIATLVNTRQSAGTYRIPFNANGLSSGVYFYRLISGNTIDSKKMTLVK